MDPKTCLRCAAADLLDGDPKSCLDRLADYAVWAGNGGAVPTGPIDGNTLARLLLDTAGIQYGVKRQMEADLGIRPDIVTNVSMLIADLIDAADSLQ